MAQRETVLITGATGFVGGAVLSRKIRDEDARVVALVRGEDAAARVLAAGAEPLIGDLREPSAGVVDAIAGADRIVHCATPAGPQAGDRGLLDRGLLAHVEPRRTRRLVYVAGSSWFGASHGDEWVDERTPPAPFGIGPTFADGLGMLAELRTRGLDAVAAYVAGVYGRGSWFLEHYLGAITRGEPVVVLDDAPVWPYVHIDDVADALVHLLRVDAAWLDAEGRDVIVSDDLPVAMDRFIHEVGRVVGRPVQLTRQDVETMRAQLDPGSFVYLSTSMRHSNARLRRLGYVCRHPTIFAGLAALGLA